MKYLFALVLATLVMNFALGETDKSFRAYVVAIDSAGKSIKLKFAADDQGKQWQELTATWDEATRWENGEKNEYKPEPATVAIVQTLKKDTKVYVNVIDASDEGKWHLEKLRTMTANSTIP